MQFSKLFVAAAFVAYSQAIVQFTNSVFAGIEAGKPFTITWTGATEPVTLKLKTGNALAQTLVSTIATGLTANSFVWTPPADTPDATYNLEIDSGSEVNYSTEFEITGGTGTTSSASAAASTTGSSSAAASTTGSSSAAASTTLTTSTTGTSSSSSTKSHSSSTASTTTTGSSSSTTNASSTVSAASVPTSNSAMKNGSPFALVVMGALAIAGLN